MRVSNRGQLRGLSLRNLGFLFVPVEGEAHMKSNKNPQAHATVVGTVASGL